MFVLIIQTLFSKGFEPAPFGFADRVANYTINPLTAVTFLGVKLLHVLNTMINIKNILNTLRKQSNLTDIYVRGGLRVKTVVKL
jgi:hypothetical protein